MLCHVVLVGLNGMAVQIERLKICHAEFMLGSMG